MKSQWAPALSVVALEPVALDSQEWLTVSTGLAAQRLRDFELLTVLDRQPGVGERLPPVRTVPELGSPGETSLMRWSQVASPNVLVTYGAGAELLEDPGGLERLARLLEHGDSSGVIGFSDAGAERPVSVAAAGRRRPSLGAALDRVVTTTQADARDARHAWTPRIPSVIWGDGSRFVESPSIGGICRW